MFNTICWPKWEKLAAMKKNPTKARTRIQLVSISINPDGKPPCRKVLNNNADQYEKPKMRKKKNISSCGNYLNPNRLDKPNNNAVHQYFFEHIKPWLKPPCRNVVHNLVTKMSKLAPMQKDSKSNRLDQPNQQEQEECSSLVFLEALKPWLNRPCRKCSTYFADQNEKIGNCGIEYHRVTHLHSALK